MVHKNTGSTTAIDNSPRFVHMGCRLWWAHSPLKLQLRCEPQHCCTAFGVATFCWNIPYPGCGNILAGTCPSRFPQMWTRQALFQGSDIETMLYEIFVSLGSPTESHMQSLERICPHHAPIMEKVKNVNPTRFCPI